jgi:glycosyltransferase involved in cell wall biosynthesis
MIIGFDISALPYGTGVSNYTLNLLENLLKIDQKNTYKLFFSSLRRPLPEPVKKLLSQKNVTLYHFRFPPTLLELLSVKLKLLSLESLIGPLDLFHTWDSIPLHTSKAKRIITIHDLSPLLYPQTHHPQTVARYQRLLKTLSDYDQIIAVSVSTQKDILKITGLSKNKITVIYEAAEEKYADFRKQKKSIQKKQISKIKKKYGLSDFILSQSTREPRKNLKRLVKSFLGFKKDHPRSTLQLALTGKYGWGDDTLPAHPDLKVLGYLPEEDMVPLHAAATLLAYPSLYEGFGLPILKAMAVGTPVITGNRSSLPEVAGSAAFLVNPRSEKEIKQAIQKIISSPQTRDKMIKEGIIQSQKFSWLKAAHQTLSLYRSFK